MSVVGTESLVNRGKSPFFHALVSLYQESQIALQDAYTCSDEVVYALKEFQFQKKLKALILQQNFPIHSVSLFQRREVNMMAIVTVEKPSIKTTPLGMHMSVWREVYNDRTGRIDIDLPKNTPITFKIAINVGCWLTRLPDKSYYCTPDELAALTLHELGHVDHWIRTVGRVSRATLDASDMIDYIQSQPPVEDILKIIALVEASPYLDKSWIKTLHATKAYFETSNNATDPAYWEALSALTLAVTAMCSQVTLRAVNTLQIFDTSKVKSATLHVDAERSADDFSARHGATAALVSALVKLENQSAKAITLYDALSETQDASLATQLFAQFKARLDFSPEVMTNGYDPLILRLQLIVETAKHAFHDADLPEDAATDLKQQITDAEQYIKSYENQSYRKTRAQIKQWLDRVSVLGRLVTSPFQDRLEGDYTHLQDATRSLSRHPLYYLAKK